MSRRQERPPNGETRAETVAGDVETALGKSVPALEAEPLAVPAVLPDSGPVSVIPELLPPEPAADRGARKRGERKQRSAPARRPRDARPIPEERPEDPAENGDEEDADASGSEDMADVTDMDELADGDLDGADVPDDLDDVSVADLDEGRALPAPARSNLPSLSSGKDSLHLYLREVGRFPLLKPDEEFDLARRVRESGDSDAAFRLVSSHLRLVVKIAMDFQRRWMQNVLDLVQEGNVGLMRAVHKFDPDKGIKFSYYASFWIKAYILKFIMDNWRMVKIGTTQIQRKLFYNLNRERQRLIAQGFDPDSSMLSERLGVSEEQISEMDQRLASTDLSLNVQVGEETGGATRMDFLPAIGPGVEESLASTEIAVLVRSHLKTILPRLNEKEQYILNNRLLTDEPITLREIGERYNITRERVRQLEARLLEKIRQHLAVDIKDFSSAWIES